MTQLHHAWVYAQRSLYPPIETSAYPCLLLLHSQWSGNGFSLDVHQLINFKCCIFIPWQILKRNKTSCHFAYTLKMMQPRMVYGFSLSLYSICSYWEISVIHVQRNIRGKSPSMASLTLYTHMLALSIYKIIFVFPTPYYTKGCCHVSLCDFEGVTIIRLLLYMLVSKCLKMSMYSTYIVTQ